MPSTIQLKFTYLIQLVNVLFVPLLGLLLALISQLLAVVIIAAFTGGQGDADTSGIGDIFIYISLAIALIYLVSTIGLILKSNFFRFTSLVTNGFMASFFGYALINNLVEGTSGSDTIITTIVVILIYLFPIYTLAFHEDTKDLFS